MRPAKDVKRREFWERMTRQAIQEAVVRLVTHNGYLGFTMDQVAEEAGVAKGTLYLHFKGKEALLESVKELSLRPLRRELSAILDSNRSCRGKLEEFVTRKFAYFDEHRDLIRFLLEERRVAQLHRKRQGNDRYKEMLSKVASVLETGMKRKEFRAMDVRKVSAILMEASIAVIVQRLWDEAPEPWEDDARILIDVFLRGIAAGPSITERHT